MSRLAGRTLPQKMHTIAPDADVAARRLDDGLSRPEVPRLVGRFDDAERQAVLHGCGG
jgi:hypothetical protein